MGQQDKYMWSWEMKMASLICDFEFVCTLLVLEVALVDGDYGKSGDLFP